MLGYKDKRKILKKNRNKECMMERRGRKNGGHRIHMEKPWLSPEYISIQIDVAGLYRMIMYHSTVLSIIHGPNSEKVI